MSYPIHRPDLTTPSSGIGRFRPRARLLRSLGEELISSETVAVLELVRNCYDADATRVELRFEYSGDASKARLELWDNGHGMTEQILLGPWLEPATDHKAGRGSAGTGGDLSPLGRRRLGSKGVGRFATQRLGRTLTLRTRPQAQDYELQAHFDWSTLEGADRYLDQLEIPWSRIAPTHFDAHGTSLLITDLRDVWTDERFERLRIGLSRLISPVLAGQTFEIVLMVNGVHEHIKPIIDRQRAMFSISGTVEEGGHALITYADLHGTHETWERPLTWSSGGQSCGSFSFQINSWDLDREALEPFLAQASTPIKSRDFKRLLREHAGISLYRDGFRILPYGEPDNDWLRLDRRRVNNPTLRFSNNQLLGWIQLSAAENPQLKDQTNREGLVDNEAYRHLQNVVIELLSMLEARRAQARRRGAPGQKRPVALPELSTRSDREIDQVLKGLETGKDARPQVGQLRELLQTRRVEVAGAVEHYAGLATGGVLAAQVYQQLQHPLLKLQHELNMVRRDLEDDDPSLLEDCKRGLVQALQLVETLQLRLRKADPFVSGRSNRKIQRIPLRPLVQEVLELYADRLAEGVVDIEWREPVPVEWLTRGEVLQQALAHILDNALYWLGQHPAGQGQNGPSRHLRITLDRDRLSIENNGPRLEKPLLLQIFEPYFSQKPEGAGLGLTIARDLLSSQGLDIVADNTELGVGFTISPRG